MNKQEIESIKWWLDVRKSTPTEVVDEVYIRNNKRKLCMMLKLDINRYQNYQGSQAEKAWKYLGFLHTTYEWLKNA